MQTLRNLGVVRLAALGGTILAVIIFFAFMATKMSAGPLALLYSGLDPSDGGSIVSQLDAMKIPYEVSANGTSIKVPTEQVGKLRMNMAQQGLPRGGSIGYEIFDQKDGFSTTSFVQNINQLRALEGELARTISTVTSIQSARVHLVLPKHEMFSQNEQKASASVFLKIKGAASLGKEQVAAIRQLIAAAVPSLQSDNVSIVDDKGNLLAKAMDRASAEGEASTQDDMRKKFEKAQIDKIEELLSRSVGYGKVRAEVSVEMDFDKVTTSSEIYDPEGQVVRSQLTKTEEGKSTESGAGTSVASNLPGGASGGSGANNANNNSEEQVNYEINKTVRSHVRESGGVKKQSVAVLVDGIYEAGADGKQVYKPRSKEELEQIKTLVRSAVNVDTARGDTIEVVNMQFASATDGQTVADGGIMSMLTPDMMRMAESIIMALLGLLAILLVVRPILKQVLEGATSTVGGETSNMLASGGGGGGNVQMLGSGGGGANRLAAPGASGAAGEADEDSFEKMIDIQRVEGRVKASSLKKVGEIVDKHPEEAVGIIRNWIYAENK